jgi:signal transduction histidine kinase
MEEAQETRPSETALQEAPGAGQSPLKPKWLLGLMLLMLHLALAWGIDAWWSRALLLSHLGLFLLWQPLWRGEAHLNIRDSLLLLAAGLILVVLSSWWLMAVWLSLLFALIGGNVPGTQHKGQRLVALAAAIYLLAILLAWVAPHLFQDVRISSAVELLIRYGLLAPILLIFISRVESEIEAERHPVDLFYSLLLFFLVAVLVLGSFAVKQVSKGEYALALAQTLFAVALLLVVVSWLWNPRAGFAGIGTLMSRYLLSVGMPFERWMHELSHFADRESDPERFVTLAAVEISRLPWITGVYWRSAESSGELGSRSGQRSEFSFHGLDLIIFTRWAFSPALLLHLRLLSRLLGDFYDAKRREQLQRNNAYAQAIYDTGARLTHDVKNLLQSLRSLCAAVEGAKPEEAEALYALMQRQLPQITQRLQGTLDKLKAPAQEQAKSVAARQWWNELKQRFADQAVSFVDCELDASVTIPFELFDSVAENLIQNSLNKKKSQRELDITVNFSCYPAPCLRVVDNGSPVPENVSRRLFAARVPSRTGLGIGLYQAAQQASQLGYKLSLANNKNGQVCFELSANETA